MFYPDMTQFRHISILQISRQKLNFSEWQNCNARAKKEAMQQFSNIWKKKQQWNYT